MNISDEIEKPPRVQESRLRDLLATEKERQQRSYRRATVLIGLVAILGAAWLAFSAFNVYKFERRGEQAQAQVAELERRSNELRQTIEGQETQLQTKEAAVADRQKVLNELQQTLARGQYQEALRVVSASNKRFQREISTELPGFIDNHHYEGPDKTVISVQVIPDKKQPGSGPWPRPLFTYELDGKNYLETPPGNRVSFSLDKAISDRRRIVFLLDFRNGEPKGYTIKVTASAGKVRSRTVRVLPQATGAEEQIGFVFAIK